MSKLKRPNIPNGKLKSELTRKELRAYRSELKYYRLRKKGVAV